MALEFNGLNRYINCGQGASLDLTQWSFLAWVYDKVWEDNDYPFLMAKEGTSAGQYGREWYLHDLTDNTHDIYSGFEDTSSDFHYVNTTVHFSMNVWRHIVTTFDGTYIKIYADKVLIETSADFSAYTPVSTAAFDLYIATPPEGGWAREFFGGLLSDARVYNRALLLAEIQTIYHSRGSDNIVNGMVGRWLMNELPDGGTTRHLITFMDNAQLDTADKKFGTASVLFDGTGDYLSIPGSADWDLNEYWTVDFWLKTSQSSGDISLIHNAGGVISGEVGDGFYIILKSDALVYGMGGGEVNTGVTGWGDGDWHHCAVVRNNAAVHIFKDGVKTDVGTPKVANTTSSQADALTPAYAANITALAGWMDEIRISKGVARWTANFDVPTEEYTTDEYTMLLLHLDGDDEATSTDDSSGRGHPVTEIIDISGNGNDGTALASPFYRATPIKLVKPKMNF